MNTVHIARDISGKEIDLLIEPRKKRKNYRRTPMVRSAVPLVDPEEAALHSSPKKQTTSNDGTSEKKVEKKVEKSVKIDESLRETLLNVTILEFMKMNINEEVVTAT